MTMLNMPLCVLGVVLMGAVRGGHELPHNHFGIIF